MYFHINEKTIDRFIDDTFAVPASEERGVDGFDVLRFLEDGGPRYQQPLVEAVGVVVERRFWGWRRVYGYDFLLDFADGRRLVSCSGDVWLVT